MKWLLLFVFGLGASTFAAENAVFVPSNPPEMKRVADTNSPAHQAAKLFLRGANLGNYLESPRKGGWGIRVSADEFGVMKREGFDHVRIPVRWSDWEDSSKFKVQSS